MGDKPVVAARADRVGAEVVDILAKLAPAERLAFVLADVFGLSGAEIGAVVGVSPLMAGQLVERARWKVREAAVLACDSVLRTAG